MDEEILLKNRGGEGDVSKEFVLNSDSMSVGYWKDSDTFHFTLSFNQDDFVSFDIDANNFLDLIKKVLINGQQE